MDWGSFSISNAAGFIKGPGKQFDDMLRSSATEIVVGSITVEQRDGNPGEVYVITKDGTSINAKGLPNPGMKFFENKAEDMYRSAQQAGKTLVWSIAGFSPEENALLAEFFGKFGAAEINFGCPNVWKNGEQKPIPSFNLEIMDKTLTLVTATARDRIKWLRAKMSPYTDPMMFFLVARLFGTYDESIQAVVTCNTVANCIVMEFGKPVLDTPEGYGGLGGKAVEYIALGQVSQFSQALQDTTIQVLGVGGINSGAKLVSMSTKGAVGIQIGTAYDNEGVGLFYEVANDAMTITGH